MTAVTSPLSGRALPLTEVPDPVFARALVGPGTAIDPVRAAGCAVAPLSGTVVSVHLHAFVIVDEHGHGILTHLGLDTVQLNGSGFEPLVAKGDVVEQGQPVIHWDPAAVVAAGKSPICPVIALDAVTGQLHDIRGSGPVSAGDLLFSWG